MEGRDARRLPVATRPPVFARTKFLAPQPRTTTVPRPHLVQRLQAADALPLSIVVGAPGSGKTSLLATWYRHVDDGTVAWLCADAADADATRFWRAFIAALQHVAPGFGEEAADLITLDGRVTSDVIESLLVDDAELDDRVRIVVDDFHLVSLDAAQQLQHLLERGLSHVRVLLGSRADPAVGLHRLRLQHEVFEVREADLRLTIDETAALVAALGLDATAIDVAALHRRTEGWAAGVQMATLSVVGAPDPAQRIAELTGTTQTVAGYLTAEVVANQSPRIQRFLEHTCVVEELDTALANALDPDHQPRVTLQEVESANLMLTRVDAAGSAYRYHQLFAEMLRNRLQAHDPQRFREQHRRAAEVYIERNEVGDAVRHLWLAGDSSRAAQLLRGRMVQVYLEPGAPPPIDLAIIPPEDALRTAPADAAGYALALMLNGHLAAAVTLLERADFLARRDGAEPIDLMHLASGLVAAHLIAGDSPTAVAWAHRLLDMLHEHDVPSGDDWVATAIPIAIRAAVCAGDLEFADLLVPEIRSHHDPRLTVLDNTSVRALLELERGSIDLALELAAEAHAVAESLDATDGGADAAARILVGASLLEQARFDAAGAEMAAGLASIGVARMPTIVLGAIGEARIHRAHGDFDAALRRLAELRQRLRLIAPGPTFIGRVDDAEVVIRLALGDFDAADALIRGLVPGFRTTLLSAWAALLQDHARAAELRATLSADGRSPRDRLDLAVFDVRWALTHQPDDVAAAADDVLEIAEPTGAVLPIAEAGASVLHAVATAARRRPRTPYVERLLAMQPLPRPADQASVRHRLDELSNRELIVLRYMVTSMTNQEIADALYLSVNTVKTHIKHVLRKLGATSRAEAAVRAQELRYL